ncbi:serine-tRNA(Ala) deacylase AlaX [Halanaeroarchaeum sulfurireducens]|uniref:Alanyl-tRNA synthetase n=1 Tax=Halanaeroarchaeum sulfurireducens TaxID=1604004 RepID=A0A0F7PEY6_9EURY|nr:serine-tRNA(Ala) deacylase AlaX [Halanaeroarchaeum sulfurireducens]AKH97908.1 alanyl-tRNA synthetase [Halanaeroarchaeum sulfurireducens]
MTHSLAAADPTVTDFDATIERVDGTDVVLEETYFYPQGGGQPADRGTIEGVPVEHVETVDGDIVHRLEREPSFDVDDEVVASVDDEFRRYTMRAHTASHILYGAGRRLLNDLGYGGFGITNEKVRVDFETTTDVTDDVLVELERLTNRAIWESRDVAWEEVPRAEALDREEVAFNEATEEGVMNDADTVRIVTIEDWDVAACGGTHVANTREIGGVTVQERSNPGEGLTRVEFAVGPTGIRRRATEHRAALSAARSIGTSVEDLPEAVERLIDERDALEAEVRSLTDEVLESRLAELDRVEQDGQTWRIGVVNDFDSNEVGEKIQKRVGTDDDVIAVSGGGGRPFVVVASSGDVDANRVVEDVTDEFGGGGGGGPTFAQGGGLDADPEEVVTFLS